MYCAAASTPDCSPELVLAKWQSVVNHVTNVHTGHGPLFNDCAHPPIDPAQPRKMWLAPDSLVVTNLEKVVSTPQVIKDMGKVSNIMHRGIPQFNESFCP